MDLKKALFYSRRRFWCTHVDGRSFLPSGRYVLDMHCYVHNGGDFATWWKPWCSRYHINLQTCTIRHMNTYECRPFSGTEYDCYGGYPMPHDVFTELLGGGGLASYHCREQFEYMMKNIDDLVFGLHRSRQDIS